MHTLFQPPVKPQFVTRDYLANVEAHLNPKEGEPFLEAVAPHLGGGHKAWRTAQRRQKEVKPVLMSNRKKHCPLELQDWLNAPDNAALKIKTNRKCQDKGICARCVHVTPGNKSVMPTPTMSSSSSSSSSSLLKKRAAPTTSQALAVGEATAAGSPPVTKAKVRKLQREVRSMSACLAHLLWREQSRINSKQV
jgi:hypothetical protein